MKIAIILGTSGEQRNTYHLVQEFAAQSDAKVFDFSKYDISYYDYQHHNRNDDFLPLIKELIGFDHIVFATPLYWYSMSAQMKVFFDRLSDLLTIEKNLGRSLKGKTTSMLSTGNSASFPDCFVEPIRLTAEYMHMPFKGHHYVQTQSEADYCKYAEVVDEHLRLIRS
ncbi:MAG: flavodoxin family protein [Psychrobium sp.]